MKKLIAFIKKAVKFIKDKIKSFFGLDEKEKEESTVALREFEKEPYYQREERDLNDEFLRSIISLEMEKFEKMDRSF